MNQSRGPNVAVLGKYVRTVTDDYRLLPTTRQGRDVMEALCQLHLRHREVLVEVYYRGRSVTEAADQLGVPPETVKARTYYALRRLRLLLEESGAGAGSADAGVLLSDGAVAVRGEVSVLDGGES